MTKIDLKKEFKDLYSARVDAPKIVDVPEIKFIMIDGEGNQMFVGPVYWRMTGYSDHHLIFNIGAGALICSGPDIPTKGTFLHFEMDFPEVGPALCAGVAYAASRHILARARYYLGWVDHRYGGSTTHLHLTLGASIWLF